MFFMKFKGNCRHSSGLFTDAVSPVVGVMLMLTLVIILAAVVSAFAGGIAGNSDPGSLIEITAETKIINSGDADTSKFEIDILSVSSPVSTKDMELKTSWKTYVDDKLVLKGNSSEAGIKNFDYDDIEGVSPIGTGPGLPEWDRSYENIEEEMNFGNYALLAGTRMAAYPADEYVGGAYSAGHSGTDCMQAVLGDDWYKLQSGDIVSVMLIHVPSGQIIYDDDVYVNS